MTEILAPVAALHGELSQQWPVTLDAAIARRRVRAGRSAFDPLEVLHEAGDLKLPFHRATLAFERAGLATNETAAGARHLNTSLLALGAAWLGGEPLARVETRRLAQRATALVVGALLARAAGVVRPSLRAASPTRTTCPACGSAPEFSTPGPEGRRLTCARCDTSWKNTTTGCLGCAATDAPTVVRIPSSDVGYELVVCNACGRYLKERRQRATAALLVERALTAQLDAAAERRGLRL